MNTVKIAVPCHSPGGLMSDRCEHFGHCDHFTLIVIADGRIAGVQVIDNVVHDKGGCSQPIELLRKNKVDTLVVSGMGASPLRKFAEAGIEVYFAPRYYSDEVYSVVTGFVKKDFSVMRERQACGTEGRLHTGEPTVNRS